jgi:hypothetical protein
MDRGLPLPAIKQYLTARITRPSRGADASKDCLALFMEAARS